MRDTRWMDRGNCIKIGPARWSRLRWGLQRAACRDCPVLIKCITWVLYAPEPIHGIVAGLDQHERQTLGTRMGSRS